MKIGRASCRERGSRRVDGGTVKSKRTVERSRCEHGGWQRHVDVSAHEGYSAFFFQAEDGIRDGHVTGVQTCALPISMAFSTSPRAAGSCSRAFFRSSRIREMIVKGFIVEILPLNL